MKRVVSVFFCLIFSLALLMLRLYTLATDPVVQSGNPHGTLTLEAASGRGTIYDCEGRPFVNETTALLAAVSPTETVLPLLRQAATQTAFDKAKTRLSKGLPTVVSVLREVTGTGVLTLRRPVRYGGTLLIPHLAGYCDGSGVGVCGLEKAYEPLLQTRTCTVTYPVNAAGRVLGGAQAQVRDEGINTQRGVVLTLDRTLQSIVHDVLLQSDMRKGAAVLLDVRTGDVKAMVSVPEWDIRNLEDSLQDEDAPFIDRTLNAVSVGSVYKMLVAAAALEYGVPETFTYTCTGETRQDDVVFHCHLRTGHGQLQMADALLHSCNTWFIELARQLPVETITDLSAAAGLGCAVEIAPSWQSDAGILPQPDELTTDAARANLAFGQGRLTASPLQIAAMTAAFANGGVYHTPRIVRATQDDAGAQTENPPDQGTRIVHASTAQTLREMLVYTAQNTAQFESFHDCGGKTATAQTGVYENGEELLNAWYSGFFPAQSPRYVLTVLFENGTSGTRDCIPIFEQIAEKVTNSF